MVLSQLENQIFSHSQDIVVLLRVVSRAQEYARLLEHSRFVSEYTFSLVLVLELLLHGHNVLLSVVDVSNDLLLTFKSCDVINFFGPMKPLEAALMLLFHHRGASVEAACYYIFINCGPALLVQP